MKTLSILGRYFIAAWSGGLVYITFSSMAQVKADAPDWIYPFLILVSCASITGFLYNVVEGIKKQIGYK